MTNYFKISLILNLIVQSYNMGIIVISSDEWMQISVIFNNENHKLPIFVPDMVITRLIGIFNSFSPSPNHSISPCNWLISLQPFQHTIQIKFNDFSFFLSLVHSAVTSTFIVLFKRTGHCNHCAFCIDGQDIAGMHFVHWPAVTTSDQSHILS